MRQIAFLLALAFAMPLVAAPQRPPRAAAPQQALPLIDVPATAGTSDTLAVLISGDGGWAAIDKSIAKVLAANGMPVVGLNSLEYFWSKKTPDVAGQDLQRILATRLASTGKSRVLLVGYSRGADVLPFMAARLPAAMQEKIRLVALLGPSPKVEFEFHVSDWLHDSAAGLPVRPEVDKLKGRPLLCVWGEDDTSSLCRGLGGPGIEVVTLKGAHHFDGAYEELGNIILQHLR